MDWIGFINAAGGFLAGLIGALGGGGIIYWRATRKSKEAEAQKNTTDARLAEADLAEKILEKYEKGILARMDQGDSVRKQEFQELKNDISSKLEDIQTENRSQNETISKQNDLISEIVAYLNGGFQNFKKGQKKKA